MNDEELGTKTGTVALGKLWQTSDISKTSWLRKNTVCSCDNSILLPSYAPVELKQT